MYIVQQAENIGTTVNCLRHVLKGQWTIRGYFQDADMFFSPGIAMGIETGPEFVNVQGAQEQIPRNRFRRPMQPGGPVRQTGLQYRYARLHRMMESIPGLRKRLQILAQVLEYRTIDSFVERCWFPCQLHVLNQQFLGIDSWSP